MVLRCAVQDQCAESGIRSVGTCCRAVRLKFPPGVVITAEKRLPHSLEAASVAELAHQVCNLRSS